MTNRLQLLLKLAGLLSTLVFGGCVPMLPEPDAKKQPEPQVVEADKRRPFVLFAPSWCPNCYQAKRDVEQLGGEFAVRIVSDEAEFPQWVTEQAAKPGWGYPLANWRLTEGNGKVMIWAGIEAFRNADGKPSSPEAAPTPGAEVERVIGLLPKPAVAFVDFGCGDGRWCIAAAERWGCKAVGVELDRARAKATRERVRALGLSHLVTIIEGDATTANVDADVAVVYLFPDVLKKLQPRLKKMRAVASYMHRVPDLPMTQNGSTWLYVQPVIQTQARTAVWQGQYYTAPLCSNPGCRMCAELRRQLYGK